MKFSINNNQLSVSYHQFLRQAGYTYIEDRRSGQGSFARPVNNNRYPRFHIYVNEKDKGEIVINIHLDQKQASYEGTTAHSGEYEDEGPVKEEVERLKILLGQSPKSTTNKKSSAPSNPWLKFKK